MKVVSDIAKSVVKLGASKAKTVAATPVFEAKGLIADTVEFSQQAVKKVVKKAEDFMPAVFKGSDVPMHHEINGFNHEIRIAHEYSAKSLPVTDREWYKMKVQSGIMRREEVDAAFARLKPLEKDCIVYRGRSENPISKSANADFDVITNAKVGDVIVPDTGYPYTAFHRSLAENWHSRGWVPDGEKLPRTMMMEIHIPKGAKVSRNLEHGGEVVMPRCAEYELVSKKVLNDEGDMEVVLKYILPKA